MSIIKSLSFLQNNLLKFSDDYDYYCKQWMTLLYMWNIHKCGIMVVSFNGKIDVLPFCNDKYDNRISWPAQELKFKLDGEWMSGAKAYYDLKSRRYGIQESKIGIHTDITKWWLNGHLLCNTLDEWSTRGLETLTAVIPLFTTKNQVFFINRRDFPVWPKEGSPFKDAFGPFSAQVPLFHKVQLGTILSFYGSDLYNDLLLPPIEHWSIKVPYLPKSIHKAVFRGTLTGRTFTKENPRLYVSTLENPLIHAGLIAWTPRDRITNGIVHFYGPSVFFAKKMTIEEQCKYAIIIYIDGHVSSSRLAWNLLSGSLVICVKSNSSAPLQWLHKVRVGGILLTPGLHYISCEKEELQECVAKYLSSDYEKERLQIAQQCHQWATAALNHTNMIEYCKTLFN